MRKNISSKNVSKNETTKTPKTLKLSKTVLEEKTALKKVKTSTTKFHHWGVIPAALDNAILAGVSSIKEIVEKTDISKGRVKTHIEHLIAEHNQKNLSKLLRKAS